MCNTGDHYHITVGALRYRAPADLDPDEALGRVMLLRRVRPVEHQPHVEIDLVDPYGLNDRVLELLSSGREVNPLMLMQHTRATYQELQGTINLLLRRNVIISGAVGYMLAPKPATSSLVTFEGDGQIVTRAC